MQRTHAPHMVAEIGSEVGGCQGLPLDGMEVRMKNKDPGGPGSFLSLETGAT